MAVEAMAAAGITNEGRSRRAGSAAAALGIAISAAGLGRNRTMPLLTIEAVDRALEKASTTASPATDRKSGAALTTPETSLPIAVGRAREAAYGARRSRSIVRAKSRIARAGEAGNMINDSSTCRCRSAPRLLPSVFQPPPGSPKSRKRTLAEEDTWLAEQKGARTRRVYRLDVAHFIRPLGIASIDKPR